jgi:methionyl-tRNA formyltransferase
MSNLNRRLGIEHSNLNNLNMTKITLLANGNLGLEVAKILMINGDKVTRVYYYGDDDYLQELSSILNLTPSAFFTWNDFKNPNHLDLLLKEPADFLISVYWPYLLRGKELNIAKDSINFHPALLPINRGWYPHVHSILDGSPTGVTLHRIAPGADTGDIWVQNKVELYSNDIASDIYSRLQDNIIDLFRKNWHLIRDGSIIPFPQNEEHAIYRKKSEIDALDYIDLDAPTTAKKVINLLRSRTFGNNGFAYFLDEDGNKIRIKISLIKE